MYRKKEPFVTTESATEPRHTAPGRLGDPELSLGTDPRVHPGVVASLAPFGLDGLASAPPVSPGSPRAELLEFAAGAEAAFEPLFEALMANVPEVDGVVSETHTVVAADGHEIKLYVSRPQGVEGPLPCIYHLHGGGMVFMGATGAVFDRWRRELAATGLVVVGVEFRNGAGRLGPH